LRFFSFNLVGHGVECVLSFFAVASNKLLLRLQLLFLANTFNSLVETFADHGRKRSLPLSTQPCGAPTVFSPAQSGQHDGV
jgi:hypothetical protein